MKSPAPYAVLLALPFLWLPPPVSPSSDRQCRVSVVLVGSTGDLARRYLWPAIFHSYMERECHPSPPDHAQGCGLMVVGGSRRAMGEEGEWQGLLSGIHCDTLSCEICLQRFTNATLRLKIGEEADYRTVSQTLAGIYRRLNCTESGRVFYLSVPPFAYVSIVKSIHTHGRPEEGAWLRVVLEKPFGDSLASARHLSRELEQYLDEDEVYRVDHYLGKSGVQQITQFRRANSMKLQPLWTNAHIQRIEVSVKERLGVEGRTEFFDKYGIIRDMHQNHLTEVLLRVLVDLDPWPSSERENFEKQKRSFLAKLWPPTLQQSILGQYNGYLSHVALQLGEAESKTPTYASVALYSRDPKWKGVPFLLTAGKQLDERRALARVVFKKWQFSLMDEDTLSCEVEVVFLIQNDELGQPGVLVSKHFSGMDLELEGSQWERVEINGCSYLFASSGNGASGNAYVSLVGDILDGQKENFVDTDSLLASWVVWDSLLREVESTNTSLELIPYSPQDLTALDFSIENTRLIATTSNPQHTCGAKILLPHSNVPALVGSGEVITSCLAEEIYESAVTSVARAGAFHLALPGGRSPKLLFNFLSLGYAEVFPWRHTHIWQTDERCVLHNHTESNWNQIDELLLSQVSIPYHQLHPIPVAIQSGVCISAEGVCGLYEWELQDVIGSVTLDHIVVGVGRDGHIASLFPLSDEQPANSSQWVWLIKLPDTSAVTLKERMTLSYETLLSARAVSVLVTGEGKEEIVRGIMTGIGNTPVMKLMENAQGNRKITFYVAT